VNSRAAARVSSALIAFLGIAVFASTLADAPRYKSWDYGPHQLVTRSLVRGIAAGHVPQWLLSGSTGDAPLDTYPWLTYAAAALLSLALGGETEAPRALLILAIGCHVTLALVIARLSSRFAPVWIATALGALALLDAGRFESGAAMTVLEVGLIHAALAQCFGLTGLLGLAAKLQGHAPTLVPMIDAYRDQVYFRRLDDVANIAVGLDLPPQRLSGAEVVPAQE
jgi:hypothetical protein